LAAIPEVGDIGQLRAHASTFQTWQIRTRNRLMGGNMSESPRAAVIRQRGLWFEELRTGVV
jgi:hypothetical protein